MKLLNSARVRISALVILFVLGSSAQAYRQVIDLGAVDPYALGAYSINDNNQIVGEVWAGYDVSSYYRAYLFDSTGGGANIYLGGGRSSALSINNNGQIVGYASTYYAGIGWCGTACLFDRTGGGNNKNLWTLGGLYSVAHSINDSGQIVGWADISSPYYYPHACLFDPTGQGNNMDIGTLGGSDSWAYSINDSGQIVGFASNSSGVHHACLFDQAGNVDLGTFSGGGYSWAYSINNSGQIVGQASGIGYEHACLFDPTGDANNNVDLGTLGGDASTAFCINDRGQIIGKAYNSSGWLRPCLFDPTGNGNNIDLNNLIDPLSGWTLLEAYSINNNGWIVGMGFYAGGNHAYLLIPEPASVMIIALGGVFLSLCRRQRK